MCTDVRQPNMIFKLLRGFSSPIISQFRVYLREIVDLYKGIFARIAKMLPIAVLNLLCQFLSPLSMQMSASDLELNYFRVCGNCRTGFSKHSVSCTLIISRNSRLVYKQIHLCFHEFVDYSPLLCKFP